MSDSLFARVATALYGEAFVTRLARDLDVGERVVWRWKNGTAWPPRGVWAELDDRLNGQRVACTLLSREIAEYLQTPESK